MEYTTVDCSRGPTAVALFALSKNCLADVCQSGNLPPESIVTGLYPRSRLYVTRRRFFLLKTFLGSCGDGKQEPGSGGEHRDPGWLFRARSERGYPAGRRCARTCRLSGSRALAGGVQPGLVVRHASATAIWNGDEPHFQVIARLMEHDYHMQRFLSGESRHRVALLRHGLKPRRFKADVSNYLFCCSRM